MAHGSLSIEKKFIWTRADSDAYLWCFGVGLLAGIAVTYGRIPLHWSGHKILLWLVPAVACRLVTRAKAGATVSALGTVAAAVLLGGELGGGLVMMPLVIVAGMTMDVAAGVMQRRRMGIWRGMALLAMAGTAAGLICFIKRLVNPGLEFAGSGGVRGMLAAGALHGLFGCLSGVIGGLGAWGLRRRRR